MRLAERTETGSVPIVPGIVLRLDPTLCGGFVPDLLLDGQFLLRRMHSSLDRRLGLRRHPGPGRGLRLDHWLCGRSPGLGGLPLTLQPAVLMLKVADLLPHLRGTSDLLLEGEQLDGMSAVLAMPGGLDAPESV